MEFSIFPFKKGLGFRNILSIEVEDNEASTGPGSRLPAIFFHPASTKLHIRQDDGNAKEPTGCCSGFGRIDENDVKKGDSFNTEFGTDMPFNLPLNKETKVLITAQDENFKIMIYGNYIIHDGERLRDFTAEPYVRKVIIGNNRPTGRGTLYISNGWHEAAHASIKGFKYNELGTGNLLGLSALKNVFNLGSWKTSPSFAEEVKEVGPLAACKHSNNVDFWGWDKHTCQKKCSKKNFFALKDLNGSFGSKCYCADRIDTDQERVGGTCNDGRGGESCWSVYKQYHEAFQGSSQDKAQEMDNIAMGKQAVQSSTRTGEYYINGEEEYASNRRYSGEPILFKRRGYNCEDACQLEKECQDDIARCESSKNNDECYCKMIVGDAEIAINGRFNRFNWSLTDNAPNSWWAVDLGDMYMIKRIVIHLGDENKNIKLKEIPPNGMKNITVWVGELALSDKTKNKLSRDPTNSSLSEYKYTRVSDNRTTIVPHLNEILDIRLGDDSALGRYVYITIPAGTVDGKMGALYLKQVEIYAPPNKDAKSWYSDDKETFANIREGMKQGCEIDNSDPENPVCVSTWECDPTTQSGAGKSCDVLKTEHDAFCKKSDCGSACEYEWAWGEKCDSSCFPEFVSYKGPTMGGDNCQKVFDNAMPPRKCSNGEGACVIQDCKMRWGECKVNCERDLIVESEPVKWGKSCREVEGEMDKQGCYPGDGQCPINLCDDGGKWECKDGHYGWIAGNKEVPTKCLSDKVKEKWEYEKHLRADSDAKTQCALERPVTLSEQVDGAIEKSNKKAAIEMAQRMVSDLNDKVPEQCITAFNNSIDQYSKVNYTKGREMLGEMLGERLEGRAPVTAVLAPPIIEEEFVGYSNRKRGRFATIHQPIQHVPIRSHFPSNFI